MTNTPMILADPNYGPAEAAPPPAANIPYARQELLVQLDKALYDFAVKMARASAKTAEKAMVQAAESAFDGGRYRTSGSIAKHVSNAIEAIERDFVELVYQDLVRKTVSDITEVVR